MVSGIIAWSKLSHDEREVVKAACSGVRLAFDKTLKPKIGAWLIKSLLLGHSVQGTAEHKASAPSGVRISGAEVTGEVDLSDCTLSGNPLPSLELEHCSLDKLNLDGARITRLSIAASQFIELSLRGAEISGSLDFSQARPKSTDSAAFVDARGARIHGQLRGLDAILRAPPKRENIPFGSQTAALHLRDADIRGTIVLRGLCATGGISLDTARVQGDVWLPGASLISGETDALRAQTATIEGSLILRNGLVARGMIWLRGVRLRGSLDLSGSKIYGMSDDGLHKPSRDRVALEASHAAIEADVNLGKFRGLGKLSFQNAEIGGDLVCDGVRIANRAPRCSGACDELAEWPVLDAYGASISGDLLMTGAKIAGQIGIQNISIGGYFSLDGTLAGAARRSARCLHRGSEFESCAIASTNIHVGSVHFGIAEEPRRPFVCFGSIDFTGSDVRGDFEVHGAFLENWTCSGSGTALNLTRSVIGGSLRLDDGVSIWGEINLLGCQIGRDLYIGNGSVANAGRSAVFAKNIVIGGDLRLANLEVLGGALRFERAQVAGVVSWEALHLATDANPADEGIPAPLQLTHSEVKTAIRAKWLTCTAPSRIDLSGVSTSTIECWWSLGWGGEQDVRSCPINLDGLRYERLVHYSERVTKRPSLFGRLRQNLWPEKEELFWLLQEWLQRQHILPHSEARFFPQPYRQLVRVLRAQGEEGIARLIACEEQRLSPTTGVVTGVWKRIFGLFGYGIRPRPAFFTALIYLLLGAAGVYAVKRDGRLVETVTVASTYSVPMSDVSEAGPERRRAIGHDGKTGGVGAEELLCTDVANSFTDDIVYALDMIMPFIPLHQETRCEISPGAGWINSILRVTKAVYSFVGWIVVSLALVTFSGLLRRFEREPA